MNTEILKEFAELKIQANVIDARIEELKPVVLKDIIDAGFDKVPTPIGNFNIKKRKVWKYSGAFDVAKKALDELKAREEAEGTATFTEVSQLEFRETPKE